MKFSAGRAFVFAVGLVFACLVSYGLNGEPPRSKRGKQLIGVAAPRPSSTDQHAARDSVGENDIVLAMCRSCYRIGSSFRVDAVPFVDSGFRWPADNDTEPDVTITFSYSNLLDGTLSGVTPEQLRQTVEEALALWASSAPLHFVEVADSGPAPDASEAFYDAQGHPQIRIGHHPIDGPTGGILAHTFLPFSELDGIAGDLHLDSDEDWGLAEGGFLLETLVHEIGHALGLDHELETDAIMNPSIGGRFVGLGSGFLLDDDIDGIQAIYGIGAGTVSPLQPEDELPEDENPDPPQSGVIVELSEAGSELMITGGPDNNTIFLHSGGWITLVWGLDGTSINGNHGEFFWTPGLEGIDCRLSDGSDTVWLLRTYIDTFSCDLGDGDDVLLLLRSRLTNADLKGGLGVNQLFSLFTRIGNLTQEGFGDP